MNRLSTRQATLVYIVTGIILIIFMIPIYLILASSLKPSADMFSRPPTVFFTPTLQHYVDLFTLRPFHWNIINSLIVTLGSTVFSVTIGALGAFALSRIRHPRINDAAFWILSMRMFPPIAVVVPYYIIFKSVGLLDTPLALIIVYSTANIPLTVWLMKGFFDEVPEALEEAAQVDGYGIVEIFYRITLPLAAPGLAVCAVFCFIFSWNEFLFALMLTGSSAQTATVAVMSFWSSDAVQWGRIMAGSFIILIPGVIFVLTCQKWLVKGLTLGSVK
ncbi:MAG TPA: carbohydrate ABC transporter permease [Shinella sp.]|jgi:multiple sugar transport system permease protein|uniref:carbohydrate ABC transporter permease n=1 Tax=Shinella sp. TaxID=1870904 RepID=UPI0029BBCBA9|nr:carbohydrate ABC transporter permease [Shinella sp.]MDX3973836.1 carbohydrate ABC transporter permease [Shinella sp.]HEV7250159.1 carbohydrate ABC transporter permease [Shinella sp.]